MRTQKISFSLAGLCTLVTAAGHALVGQAHLTRILGTSVENIDSAVIFAVWHMATVVLVVSGIGLLFLVRSKQNTVVRTLSLTIGILYGLFGVVFLLTSFIFSEPTIQWIFMFIISILSLIGHVSARNSIES